MKNKQHLIRTGILLIFLSFLLHALHFVLFKDLKHIFVYLLGDIAFIPLEVFIVSLVIDQLLERREKQERFKKVNMLIGLFYQELGLRLLGAFTMADPHVDQLQKICHVTPNWQEADFRRAEQAIGQISYQVSAYKVNLDELQAMLAENKSLLINLIANPTLLEHETFSELLLAVSHLQDELQLRASARRANPKYENLDHLQIDMERAYGHLMVQWLRYIEHLKSDYPFLFATALVTNPLNR